MAGISLSILVSLINNKRWKEFNCLTHSDGQFS